MNDWARSRKRIILAILILILFVLVGVPLYFLLHSTPTCSDGLMNGDETGIDCGGSCQRLCRMESLPIIIKGDPRVLKVATSTYEVVALLENPNPDAQILKAHYTLSLFAEGSLVPVKKIEGSVFVPKNGSFALFEGPFTIADVAPTQALLEWDEASLVWSKDATKLPVLDVEQSLFSRLETAPRLEALVKNTSLDSVRNIDLTALIFDAEGNIMAASKTFIDSLGSEEEKQAIFTWPQPFAVPPVEVQVLTSVLP